MSNTTLHGGTRTIDVDGVRLVGELRVPSRAPGVVLFAHGSGSSRLSPRNQLVAQTLNRSGLATLLFDLLTDAEAELDSQTRHLRFDIELLGRRLTAVVDWQDSQPSLLALPVGLFGASTGAAAALITAANRPERIGAVVSRGGRPDLASAYLARVRAPTLLIVGALDTEVIEMNHEARRALAGEVRLEIVPGATHLFEEHGALEQVAKLASNWFKRYLK